MPSDTDILTEDVEYVQGDDTLQGYLAYDKRVSGASPGVLVFPEWWGVNDYIKQRTRMLAELGYVAFAADMYGDGRLAANAEAAARTTAHGMETADLYRTLHMESHLRPTWRGAVR